MSQPKKKLSTGAIIVIVLAGVAVVTVPIVGILAAIAIPSFTRYTQRAKALEATSHLTLLRAAVQNYCTREGRYPPSASPLPASPSTEPVAAAFASDPTFSALGFAPGPVRYSYSLVNTNDGRVRLVARGDLDGDALQSEYVIECYPGCHCDASVRFSQELE